MTKPKLPPGVPEISDVLPGCRKAAWYGVGPLGSVYCVAKAIMAEGRHDGLFKWSRNQEKWSPIVHDTVALYEASFALLADLEDANSRADEAEAERDHLQSVLDQIKHPHG